MRRRLGLLGPLGLLGVLRPLGLLGLLRPLRPLGLLGILGVMACSHGGGPGDVAEPEQPPVENSTPIAFAAAEQQENAVTRSESGQGCTRSQTRAEGLEEKGVTSFTVWGYKNTSYDNSTGSYGDLQPVFPGYTVNWIANSANTTASNSDDWEYAGIGEQTIKYWDWAATAYRFFAATGTTATSESTGANGTTEAYEITIAADVAPVYYTEGEHTGDINVTAMETKLDDLPYFTRLWFSTGNKQDYPTRQFGQPVQLEFLKPYSKVRFCFKYVFPREGIKTFTVNSFKPTADYEATEENKVKIAMKGTITVHYPLIGTATNETYNTTVDQDKSTRLEAFTEDYDLEDDTKLYPETGDGWYIVFPNNQQDSYTLSVTINGTEKTAVVPAEYMQWLPGYSYTYIFKINEEGGVEIDMVESAFTPWPQPISSNHEVYNW